MPSLWFGAAADRPAQRHCPVPDRPESWLSRPPELRPRHRPLHLPDLQRARPERCVHGCMHGRTVRLGAPRPMPRPPRLHLAAAQPGCGGFNVQIGSLAHVMQRATSSGLQAAGYKQRATRWDGWTAHADLTRSTCCAAAGRRRRCPLGSSSVRSAADSAHSPATAALCHTEA